MYDQLLRARLFTNNMSQVYMKCEQLKLLRCGTLGVP